MEVRDPIYGLIKYDEKEEKLINTSTFQRLRGIKQLALADLVYPGAHHTRFEHCIGTMHLAGKIAKKLKLEDDERDILRLTGLLHDIGHGPFSHVSEQIMDKCRDKEILKKYNADNAHELMSILIILKDKEISEILSSEERDQIVNLLQKKEKRNINKDIVSGPLDVDKLDYLYRDSYFAGVEYGKFDLDKIIESLTKIDISTEGTTLGISEQGIYALEQLLLAKYHMNAQVYKHRIRRITDAMLVRGIEYAIKESEEIKSLFTPKDTEAHLDEYIKYDDRALIDEIFAERGDISVKYFEKIKKRELFKEILAIDIDSHNFRDSVLLQGVKKLTREQMREIAEKTASLFSFPEDVVDFVIVDKQTTQNPTFKPSLERIDTETIMVEMRDGSKHTFSKSSDVFRNPAVAPVKEKLYIYLPLDIIESRDERRTIIKSKQGRLREIIKEVAS